MISSVSSKLPRQSERQAIMVHNTQPTDLENYFSSYRRHIIGQYQVFDFPFGKNQLLYADWIASGRGYQPLEEYIQREVLPFMANTHTTTTITGSRMSQAYEEAKQIIKKHVHANADDALIFCGSGMTHAVNKLQRILGLRVSERITDYTESNTISSSRDRSLKPVVFITQMEHHSNHISWLETIADVEIISCSEEGNVDLEHLGYLLEQYKQRQHKIAAVTACSNVTGIETPYHTIAEMMHGYNGLCFVDFACSAPYVDINMHPEHCNARLDAVYFSPHKFLGGPGTPGVLIFNKKLYSNKIPDHPGGGTVIYSNPWKQHEYTTDIEQREDGGTPPVLQAIKAAMCILLKEDMGVRNIIKREQEMLPVIFDRFSKMPNVDLLEGRFKKRLGIFSFIIPGAHHNLIVRLLNDRFGIQSRGGCSCAGTYGHRLLQVDEHRSARILTAIRSGDLSGKPGWVRLSVHPTMTLVELEFMMDALEETALRFNDWKKDYQYNPATNEYDFTCPATSKMFGNWFAVSNWESKIFPVPASPGIACPNAPGK